MTGEMTREIDANPFKIQYEIIQIKARQFKMPSLRLLPLLLVQLPFCVFGFGFENAGASCSSGEEEAAEEAHGTHRKLSPKLRIILRNVPF